MENNEWFARRYKSIRLWGNYWPLTLILSAVVMLLWVGGPQALPADDCRLNLRHDPVCSHVECAGIAAASWLTWRRRQRRARVFETWTRLARSSRPDAKTLDHVMGVRFEHVSFAPIWGAALIDMTLKLPWAGDCMTGRPVRASRRYEFTRASTIRLRAVLIDGIDAHDMKKPAHTSPPCCKRLSFSRHDRR